MVDQSRFKNQINIDGKNHLAYADAAVVEVFINGHIVNNTLIMICFILVCSVETLSMRRINTGVHRICQIELIQGAFQPVSPAQSMLSLRTFDPAFCAYFWTVLLFLKFCILFHFQLFEHRETNKTKLNGIEQTIYTQQPLSFCWIPYSIYMIIMSENESILVLPVKFGSVLGPHEHFCTLFLQILLFSLKK